MHRVAEWLAEGRDVNAVDQQGNTALHWSCLLGLQSLTSLLLAHEARTDVRNSKGSCAVHFAVAGRNVAAMKLLSGQKSSQTSRQVLRMRDGKGLTPFLAAAEINDATRFGLREAKREVYMMEWLYLQGAALDQRDFRGQTAAQLLDKENWGWESRGLYAAKATRAPCSGCEDLKRALAFKMGLRISHNASLLERDNVGQTAFHSACATGCHDAIKMLLDATTEREIRTDGFSCALQPGAPSEDLKASSMC